MKRLLFIFALLCAPAFGQALSGVNGDCQIGGQQALTSGLPSTGTQQIGTTNVNAGAGVQASFPQCLVTVYLTGTTNKANIYSDNSLTPAVLTNPFVANVDGSFTFFAAAGCYDVVMASGAGPALPYSRSLPGICVGQGTITIPGGSGTVSACGTPGAISFYQVAGTTVTCDPLTVTDGAGNWVATSMTFNGAGAGFVGFVEGTVPPLNVANTAYLYSDTSIPTTFGTVLPTAPGTLNQVLAIMSVVDATHIKTGWTTVAGTGNLTGTLTTGTIPIASGAQALSDSFITDASDGYGITRALDPTPQYVNGLEVNLSTNNASVTAFAGTAVRGNVTAAGSANIAAEAGFAALLTNSTAHTVTDAFDFFAQEPANTGGGTITNFYGYYLRNMGTVATKNYGLYAQAQADPNAWFLYGPIRSLLGTIQFSTESGPKLDFGNGTPSASDANGSIYIDAASAGGLWSRYNGVWVPIYSAPALFSALPTCTSSIEGARWAVTDSTTATWGATITGTGGNHVLAYCNGTNWTVAAK